VGRISNMSGTGDERWRGGRGASYEQNRQSGQQQRQSGARDKPSSAQQGGRQNTQNQGQSQGQDTGSGKAWSGLDLAGPATTTQGGHVPVKGYNAQEVEQALRREQEGAVATKSKPLQYKPSGKEGSNPRQSNPWASKPNTMASGKDFFLELRKQISTFQNAQGG